MVAKKKFMMLLNDEGDDDNDGDDDDYDDGDDDDDSISRNSMDNHALSKLRLNVTLYDMAPGGYYLETDPDPVVMVIRVELFIHKPCR